jgi:leucyl aminopeptidase (aminopeptidase T)
MQLVPVVAIGITVVAVSRSVSAEAMQGVLVQSETMRANVAAAEASHVLAAKATEMTSAAKASDVTSTAKTAAHMAAATEAAATEAAATEAAATSAVTATTAATTAGIGRACEQARSEKSCCQYRDYPFHRDTPFQSDCSAA